MAQRMHNKVDLTLKELSLSATTQHVPGNTGTLSLRGKKLVCVEYPALVQNLDRVLESLGGEQTVSKTYDNPNRRLEMRFRPQDPFCHCLCANRFDSSNLLLKVRRRVRKSEPKDAQIHMEIVGVIGTTYKFQGMADFQCLAVSTENGSKMSLYDRIILTRPESHDFFEQPQPCFLPPAIFSRLDTPVDYFYRRDVHQNPSGTLPKVHKNFIGLNRARRPHNAIFVTFNDPVPNESMEAARLTWQRICVKECDKKAEQEMRAMFERRPIWSRNAVKANINVQPDKLKLLLPVFAYYMVTGPWRSLWVRLGYDPRKNPESKQYQMLDFRMRCSMKHGYSSSDLPVKAKRSALNYSLPITVNKSAPQPASLMSLPEQEKAGTSQDSGPSSYQLKESAYIFREGMLPPHRQMFYQLCDIHVESIQRVVHANKGIEKSCDERDGWCVVGTTDQLRDMISAMVNKVIKANKPSMRKDHKRPRSSMSAKVLQKDEEEDSEDQDEDLDETKDEDEEEEEYQPSEESENEMETEMLDYM